MAIWLLPANTPIELLGFRCLTAEVCILHQLRLRMPATKPSVILVVDDDPDLRETLVDVLEGAGYLAHAAEHGAAALSLLRDSRELPALVLLDMMMPVMSGDVFVGEMRKDPRLAELPVVILTARSDHERVATALGARASLAKPLKLEQLLAVVQKVVQQSTQSPSS